MDPVVDLTVLWPELDAPKRMFEVEVTVQRTDDGQPLLPCTLPPEVLSCWSAEQAYGSVTVMAVSASGALAVAEVLMPELARAPGALVTVKGISAA